MVIHFLPCDYCFSTTRHVITLSQSAPCIHDGYIILNFIICYPIPLRTFFISPSKYTEAVPQVSSNKFHLQIFRYQVTVVGLKAYDNLHHFHECGFLHNFDSVSLYSNHIARMWQPQYKAYDILKYKHVSRSRCLKI